MIPSGLYDAIDAATVYQRGLVIDSQQIAQQLGIPLSISKGIVD